MLGLRTTWIGVVALVCAVTVLGPMPFAAAAFTATSTTTATVSAAADWTPPNVALVSPGAVVTGTVQVGVEARDAESAIAQVAVELLASEASEWTPLCVVTTAPWGCTWKSSSVPDGQYTLRATAVDGSGLRAVSEPVRVRVANTLSVSLASPGDAVRGTVPLVASVHQAGSVAHTVRIEYAVADTTTWRTLCTQLTAPYTCAWNTTAFAAGAYDLRAVLVIGGSSIVSEVVEEVEVDNVAPTVVLGDPGAVLSGAVTLRAEAQDAHSGVDQVVIQAASTSSGPWRDLCVREDEPWSCRIDTAAGASALSDGRHHFRAVATDLAGNTAVSAVVGPRTVDNTVSAVVVDAPSFLSGVVSVGAIASANAGVAQVRIEYAPSGSGRFTSLCTDTTAPYACLWDTTTVVDGNYDLRAVMTDHRGVQSISALDAENLVSNTTLRAFDIQTSNGSTIAGRPGSGDTVTFTYTGEVKPSSLLAGWSGQDRAVTLRLRDGALVGRSGKEDDMDVLVGSTAVNLGQVNLKRDHVRGKRTVLVNATMSARTVVAGNGTLHSVVTLRLGSTASGSTRLRTVTGTGTMVWTPSTRATDLLGRACAPHAVSESGPADREF